MPNEYTPDVWVAIKVTNKETSEHHYRILAGWGGGYMGADSWRLNSGIERISLEEDVYHVYGGTGSVYNCFKESERFNMLTAGIFQGLQESTKLVLEHISFEDVLAEIGSNF